MKDRRISRWVTAAGLSLLLHGLFFLLLAVLLPLWPAEPPQEPVLEIDLVSGGGSGGASSASGGGQDAFLALPPAAYAVSDASAGTPAFPDSALPVSGGSNPVSAGTAAGTGNGRGIGEGARTGNGQGNGDGNGSGPADGEGTGTVEAPRILSAPEPVYPEAARRRGQEGTAVVGLLIGEDGTIRETWIETSAGDASLDEAALEAVRSWRFVPARQGGSPVAARSRVPVVFQLH